MRTRWETVKYGPADKAPVPSLSLQAAIAESTMKRLDRTLKSREIEILTMIHCQIAEETAWPGAHPFGYAIRVCVSTMDRVFE